MLTHFSATVCTLNVATVVTFLTLRCALRLLLQRITQVLTVVMISHMFLNLKGLDRRNQEDAESRGAPSSSCMKGPPKLYVTMMSLETRASGPKNLFSVVGTLGSDLQHTFPMGYWITADVRIFL